MRDLLNKINPKPAINPQTSAVNAAIVGAIIDRQGFDSVTYLLAFGALFAGSSFAVTMEHGDDAALADTAAVAAADLVGTLALAGGTQAGGLANTAKKVAYVGAKRYTRLTITPAANGATSVLSASAILGHASQMPTANPPV
jgi:hypothetical protein